MKTQDRRDLSSPRRADLFPISFTLGYVVALLVDQPWVVANAIALPLWALCTAMLGLIWLRHFNATLKARQLVAAGVALTLAAWLAPSCKHNHDTAKTSGNDDPTIITELPPDTVFYLNDHLGSPVVEFDARGNVIRERSYHPYGSVRRSRGRAGDPWSYVGNEYDSGSDLGNFHARAYNPRGAAFLSPDPVAVFSPERVLSEPSRLHPYGYGSGDPINRVDANGEVWDVVVDGFFVGFDVGVIIGQNVIQGRTDTLGTNLGALAADVGCAFLPFATGGGLAVRAANKVDNVFITYAAAKRAAQAQVKAQQAGVHLQSAGGKGVKPGPKPGGPTDQLNARIADELEEAGMAVTHGGGRGKEEYFVGPNGGRKGSNRADLTAVELQNSNLPKQRVQTVDTYANGLPTRREWKNAGAIIKRNREDGMTLIPKKPRRN